MAGRKPIVTDDPTDNPFQWLHDSFGSRPEREIQRDVSERTHERFSPREPRLAEDSADLPRGSLSYLVDGCFCNLDQFEYPTWREIVRLVTGAPALTEIDSVGQLNIGMTLPTKASDCF